MKNEKSLWEILIIPISITIVGALGTYFIAAADRENAVSISSAQIENANNLKELELKKIEENDSENRRLELIKLFGKNLGKCENNLRQNAITLIKILDSEFSQSVQKSLTRCNNEDTPHQKTTQQTVEEFRELLISLDSIKVIEDGTWGRTNWYFHVLLNNEIFITSETYFLENKEKKIINGKVNTIKVKNAERKKITIQGYRAKGKGKGLLASSKKYDITIDFKKNDLKITTIPVLVAGFPDKGDFLVNVSYQVK